MNKHTPGPWTSYPCNLEKYSRVITAKGAMVQVADVGVHGKVACTKEVYGDRMTYAPYEETTANARLITAAPELLEALKVAAENIDSLLDFVAESNAIRMVGGLSAHAEARGVLDRIDAVVAKATGEQA